MEGHMLGSSEVAGSGPFNGDSTDGSEEGMSLGVFDGSTLGQKLGQLEGASESSRGNTIIPDSTVGSEDIDGRDDGSSDGKLDGH